MGAATATGCDGPLAQGDAGGAGDGGLGAPDAQPGDAGALDTGPGDAGPQDAGPPPPTEGFIHGVASGDPLADAVILWTRFTAPGGATGAQMVTWELARDAAFTMPVTMGMVMTDMSRDFTVKVDATGLMAGTTYYYRFKSGTFTSPVGRTRTAPSGATPRLRFAVVACSSYAHGYFHAYRSIAERLDLDAVIHLGDYIYEYGTNQYGMVRPYDPPTEIVSLADYRRRYAHYRKDRDLQAVHQQHPFIVIWDDHESTDNSYRDGAENHQANEGLWTDRRRASAQAYFEWMPIRDQLANLDIYRTLKYGNLAELILADTRIHGRSQQVSSNDAAGLADASRTLLGTDQETWLAERLAMSTARWKLLCQQVMVTTLESFINTDQWDGYGPARNRLYDQLEMRENVVVLTGDIHSSWANDLPRNPATYVAATGAGSVGVEFVAPGISSPGFPVEIPIPEAWIKWKQLTRRGYIVLDLDEQRAQAAWFLLDRVDRPAGAMETFAKAYSVRTGERFLREDAMAAAPRPNPPEAAPGA